MAGVFPGFESCRGCSQADKDCCCELAHVQHGLLTSPAHHLFAVLLVTVHTSGYTTAWRSKKLCHPAQWPGSEEAVQGGDQGYHHFNSDLTPT